MKLTEKQYEFLRGLFDSSNPLLSVYPGALIYSSEQNTNQLILIKEGEVRLIDNDSTYGTKTLTKIKGYSLFGTSNLIKIPTNEIIRASKLTNYFLINYNDISIEKQNKLSLLSFSNISYFELKTIHILLQNLFKSSSLNNLSIDDFSTHVSLLTNINSIEDKQLMLYADKPNLGFKYGQVITFEVLNSFFKGKTLPRIICINIPEKKKKKKKEISSNDLIWSNYYKSNPELRPAELPDKSFPIQNNQFNKSNSVNKKYGFSFISGKDRHDSYIACLNMIIQHFDLPTRKDTVRKIANIMDQDDIPWNPRLVSILDNIGLSVRSVAILVGQPQRIPTPSVWIDKGGICSLVVAVSQSTIVIYDPVKGPLNIPFKQASEFFKDSNNLITLSVGLHTPKNRFKLSWLIPYVRKYRIQLIEVFGASFLTQIFALATPLLFQQIIDRVISKGATDALSPMMILMLLFVILEILFSSLRTFQFVEVSNRIDISVGSAIMSRLLKLNARFFDRKPVGELSSRLGELENIRRFLTGTALTVVLDAFFAIIYFLVMFYYNVTLTLVVLFTLPFLFLVTVGLTPVTQRLIRGRAEAASRTQSFLVEILSGIQTVKLQNAELVSKKQWEDRHLKSINQGFNAVLANTLSSNLLQLISKVSNILIIGIGASLVLNNKMTLGQLIAFRIISGYVTQPMLRLASTWQNFQEMSLSLERVGDVVNQPLEISEDEEENIVMPKIKGNIQADSISYSYSSNSDPVLSSVSLNVPKGSFTGIVGQSGCGKSSLLKIIPRLYKPTSGRLLIDNYDISKVDLYSLRNQIGFVPQDCMLFEGSVFSNIALGDPLAESDDVVRAAKIACAHEFIMTLPYGYSTAIGEKGSGLSGGQRQRIALARMLLESPNLVILDEATSALDVDTERQVVANLKEHFKEQTMLMITHRLSTLKESDQIIVMHNGKVDSIGDHLTLMDKKGRYYALYQSQFGEADSA